MTLTTRTIEITLEECVIQAKDTKIELEETISEINEELKELREQHGDDFEPPEELLQTRKQARQQIERQEEAINRTLMAIENNFIPEGGGIDDIEDTTMTFEELNIGDGVDMQYSAGIDENSTQEEIKAAERKMMGMYLNKMVKNTPEKIPSDMTELPMAVGEAIFNELDKRLEEGNGDLSVSQIRQVTETS